MKDDYAVVTGGEMGIGRALVIFLAQKGYNVLVNYFLSEEGAKQVVEKIISEYGVKAAAFKADVREYSEVKALRDFGVSTFGENLKVFVNNAGTGLGIAFLDETEEQYTYIIKLNLLAAMHCAHLFAPLMVKNKFGRYVFIASTSGLRPSQNFCDYGTSKAGIIGLTRGLALEFGKHGITVNNIAPGFINTEKSMAWGKEFMESMKESTPLHMVGTTDDVAQALDYIINAPYVTGQTIVCNGGSFMP